MAQMARAAVGEGGAQGDPAGTIGPGCGVVAVFPRMAGKERPGVVVHMLEQGVVALPLTTRRTNQPGRLELDEAELQRLGFERRSHLLLPRAAYLPVARIAERRGQLSDAMLAQVLGEMVEWYGLDWRQRDAALRDPGAAPRLLHPRRRPSANS